VWATAPFERPTSRGGSTRSPSVAGDAISSTASSFDEELVRNQDDELNFRIVQAGGRIWLDPELRSDYRARQHLGEVWRQYYEYGLYKVRVAQKRGGLAAGRQVVPGAFVAALGAAVVTSLVTRRWSFSSS
jgi:hypothetical protein